MISAFSFIRPKSTPVSVSRSEGSPVMIDLTKMVVTNQKSLGLYLNGVFFNIAAAFGASSTTLETLRPHPSSNIQAKKAV